MIMYKFKIIQCRFCGSFKITNAKKSYRCNVCGKINNIYKCKILKYCFDAIQARDELIKLKTKSLDKKKELF